MWNLEKNWVLKLSVEPGEELVLKVWNLEKNWFLMWNLETTTTSEWMNELMPAELPSGVWTRRARLSTGYHSKTNESGRFEKWNACRRGHYIFF